MLNVVSLFHFEIGHKKKKGTNMKSILKTSIILFGLLSASATQAALVTANAELNYGQEVAPSNPNPSMAFGSASVVFDTVEMTLDLTATITGIFLDDVTFPSGGLAFGNLGPFHIHNAPAGANGAVVVPFELEDYYTITGDGLMVEVMGVSFDSSLLSELEQGNLYLNLHTLDYASGEIRGQLSMVSAPATISMIVLSVVLLSLKRKS